MKSMYARAILGVMMIAILLTGMVSESMRGVSAQAEMEVSAVTLPEGNDFATQVLNDPWDMNEYSDVSQDLNSDGNYINLTNLGMANGIFSATWGNVANGEGFYPLFPGFNETIPVGKQGERYPIDSAKYHCLYIAMKVESPKVNSTDPQPAPDFFKIFWFANHFFAGAGGTYGAAYEIVYPEQGFNDPLHYTSVYKVDLNNPSAPPYGFSGSQVSTPWNGRSQWQGLRIDPSNKAGVRFNIDWVRLTDCSPVNYAVTWTSPTSNISIWAHPVDKPIDYNIRIASGLTGTGATLDLQGLDAGTYELKMSSVAQTCCRSTLATVTINRAPVVRFTSPSYTSSYSYVEKTGNAWEFNSSAEVDGITCMTYSFTGGRLVLDTASVERQPSNCVGGSVSNPEIMLKSSQYISTTEYRYLTFRVLGESTATNIWSGFGGGTMARWVWFTDGCINVGNAMYYDVGWNTYSYDLWNPYAGQVVQHGGTCSPNWTNWRASGNAHDFRFDPNENISGHNLHQEFAYISLNAMNEISTGRPFEIKTELNKPADGVSYKYYYTTDRNNPRQHAASIAYVNSSELGGQATSAPAVDAALRRLYLPMAQTTNPAAVLKTAWSTTGVAPGEYYLCAEAKDSYNSSIACSEVTVLVLP